jgi:hypothetical protein
MLNNLTIHKKTQKRYSHTKHITGTRASLRKNIVSGTVLELLLILVLANNDSIIFFH